MRQKGLRALDLWIYAENKRRWRLQPIDERRYDLRVSVISASLSALCSIISEQDMGSSQD
jgi:hypothetical protein